MVRIVSKIIISRIFGPFTFNAKEHLLIVVHVKQISNYEQNFITEGTDLLVDKKKLHQLNKNLHQNARSEQHILKVLFCNKTGLRVYFMTA